MSDNTLWQEMPVAEDDSRRWPTLQDEPYRSQIESQMDEILEIFVHKNEPEQVEILRRAFILCDYAHRAQPRKTGEPYIFHPLYVTRQAALLGMDTHGLVCALLHDVVEDSDEFDLADIERMFGKAVRDTIDGLTKIEDAVDEHSTLQAENLKKILLTLGTDVNVSLIKLLDRLHNLETMSAMKPDKQYKKSNETLAVYAPLAHRLGLWEIKNRLETLAFGYANPSESQQMAVQVKRRANKEDELFERVRAEIEQHLRAEGFACEVFLQKKSCYSIWLKLREKKIDFDSLENYQALRVVFKPRDVLRERRECFNIYSAVTELFAPKSEQFRDWTQMARGNDYEALHGGFSIQGKTIFFQVLSERMQAISRRGVLMEREGKLGRKSNIREWIDKIPRELAQSGDAAGALSDFMNHLHTSDIQVYDDDNKSYRLPKGATVLDFAFALHTELGLECVGGRIDKQRDVGRSHELGNYDRVHVERDKGQEPEHEWLNIVKTATAKTALKRALALKRSDKEALGGEIFDGLLARLGQADKRAELLEKLKGAVGLADGKELLYQLGNKSVLESDLLPHLQSKPLQKLLNMLFSKSENGSAAKNGSAAPKEQAILSDCCSPIFGDDVMAFRRPNGSLVVHKTSCEKVKHEDIVLGSTVVPFSWDAHAQPNAFTVRLMVEGYDRDGLTHDLTQVISSKSEKEKIKLKRVHLETNDSSFGGYLDVQVDKVAIVKDLISNINLVKGVKKVYRDEHHNPVRT